MNTNTIVYLVLADINEPGDDPLYLKGDVLTVSDLVTLRRLGFVPAYLNRHLIGYTAQRLLVIARRTAVTTAEAIHCAVFRTYQSA